MRKLIPAVAIAGVLCGLASLAFTQTGSVASKKLPASFLKKITPKTMHSSDASFGVGKVKYLPDGTKITPATSLATSGLPGVDSAANWSDQFTEPGYDYYGNPQAVWPYTMVGTPPESGQTTIFRAPIVPVTVDLLGSDGKVAVFNGHTLTFAPTPDMVKAIVNSPIFQPFTYTSGVGQFNDQQMRAQFANRIHDNNWHNILAPVVRQGRRMQIPYGFWFFFTDANNNPVAAAVDSETFVTLLFPETVPVDNSTPVGAAELAGDITTHDISTFTFNNVYLYINGDVTNCCALGFHTYDFEPGDSENGNRERIYLTNYSAWVTNGLFPIAFEDITALSHEMAEAFNDPFANNLTPWWESIDPISGNGQCQDLLEVGDVIEDLNIDPTFAVSLGGRTYHPQNVALFPWLAFESPSPAHLKAYSFPDETTLISLSPRNLLPGCVPAP